MVRIVAIKKYFFLSLPINGKTKLVGNAHKIFRLLAAALWLVIVQSKSSKRPIAPVERNNIWSNHADNLFLLISLNEIASMRIVIDPNTIHG